MATNKRILVEQIMRRLAGGNIPDGFHIHRAEVEKALEQVINSMLRPQFFQTLQGGDTVPEGCVLANYDVIPVESWAGVSRAKLPAIPVTLPKNMGVFRIGPDFSDLGAFGTNVFEEFIPVPIGQMAMVQKQRMISDLLGTVGYELRGGYAVFTKDLKALSPAINTVNMQLVVMDFSQFGDYDMLPLNAEMEAEAIESVVKMFAPTPVNPNVVDPTSDSK